MRRSTPFGHSPFSDLNTMFERMNRQFEEMNRRMEFGSGSEHTDAGITVDVADETESVVVTANLPGFEKDDIDLSVANQALTIRADRDVESEHEADNYVRRERHHSSVNRTVGLPAEVRKEAAAASYVNGVLTVTLPKLTIDEEDSHQIDIE